MPGINSGGGRIGHGPADSAWQEVAPGAPCPTLSRRFKSESLGRGLRGRSRAREAA